MLGWAETVWMVVERGRRRRGVDMEVWFGVIGWVEFVNQNKSV